MKMKFLKLPALLSVLFLMISCSKDNDYIEPVPPVVYDPVSADLALVPYEKLSDYNFFIGDIKALEPNERVIPYKPASELFSDYALKKRFVWLPENTSGTYVSDAEILDLPVGAILIKNFYYDNTLPSNTTRIIETRLLIKKTTGWIFANYIWNDQQTDAFIDVDGATTAVSWTDASGTHDIEYEIPSQNQCSMCHLQNEESFPIGIKPQNLNHSIAYADGNFNQLQKLISLGYLESAPPQITSVVNYNDVSQDLTLRVRSYFDSNCAHCHRDGANAFYTTPRFAFDLTGEDPANMGVCVGASIQPPGIPHGRLIDPQNVDNSVIHYVMNTTNSFYIMPRVGRTVVHTEAVQMVEQWINSLPECE